MSLSDEEASYTGSELETDSEPEDLATLDLDGADSRKRIRHQPLVASRETPQRSKRFRFHDRSCVDEVVATINKESHVRSKDGVMPIQRTSQPVGSSSSKDTSKQTRKTPSQKKTPSRVSDKRSYQHSSPLSGGMHSTDDCNEHLASPPSRSRSSTPPPTPTSSTTPTVSVALREITSLLNTVVKRIDRMEDELKKRSTTVSSSSPGEHSKSKSPKTSIPLVVKSEVRKTYKLLLEDEENEFEGFDFDPSASFNGPSNAVVVTKLIKEVKANNPQFQACHIRSAIYTYYRTKSQEKSLKERGIYSDRNRARRRRERLLRKLQERSSTFKKMDIPPKTKEKWSQVLNADVMSSEESTSECEDVFVKSIPWRADRVNKLFMDLDEKGREMKTSQAKRQRKNRILSDTPSTRSIPSGLPKWAIKG